MVTNGFVSFGHVVLRCLALLALLRRSQRHSCGASLVNTNAAMSDTMIPNSKIALSSTFESCRELRAVCQDMPSDAGIPETICMPLVDFAQRNMFGSRKTVIQALQDTALVPY